MTPRRKIMTHKKSGAFILFLLITTAVWATGASEPVDPDAPTEIEYLTYGGAGTIAALENNEDFVAAAILDKFNIVIDPELPAFNEQQDVLIARIAAGDYPDWMYVREESLYRDLLEDGIIANLSPYIDTLTLPDLQAHLELPAADTLKEPDGWFGIPVYFGYSMNGLYYRKDWVEELGLSLPETTDDFKEFLQTIVDADPDGYGTTGITAFNPQGWLVREIGTSFTGYHKWRNQGGRWDFYAIDEAYRDFLYYVQDLYESGLIDPDAVTQPRGPAQEKFASGRAAAFYLNFTSLGRISDTLQQLVPDAEVGLMAPEPAGPAGSLNYSLSPMRYRNVANADIDEEKITGFLRVLDWISSEEGTELALWGIEGEDYVVNDNGTRLRLPVEPAGSRLFGAQGYYLTTSHRLGATLGSRPDPEASQFATWASENSVIDDVQAFGPPRYRELEAITQEIVNRYFLEFTFNGLDIDANWDSYVREVREAGIDEMASILAADYPR
jgi:ABC-type glycerol-3-phosphate transport system substrate-binding protein